MHCGIHFRNGKNTLPVQDPRENLVPWPGTPQKMFPIETEYKRYQAIQEFQRHKSTPTCFFLLPADPPPHQINCWLCSEADFKRFLRQKHGGNLIRAWRQALTEGADLPCNIWWFPFVYIWRNFGSVFPTRRRDSLSRSGPIIFL